MGSVGSNSLNNFANRYSGLQDIIDTQKLYGLPTILPNTEFDNSVQTQALDGVELYRGVGKDSTYKEQLEQGATYTVGKGGLGEGLYFSIDPNIAPNFADRKNLDNTTLTAYIDKSKAKPIDIKRLEQMWERDSGNTKTFRANPTTQLEKLSTEGLSAYAMYKGYNVIIDKSEGFYVPLTRDVLVIRQKSKVKELI